MPRWANAPERYITGPNYTLTNGVELAPGATKEYWIRFAVTRNPAAAGYNEANLACSTPTGTVPAPGYGLFNEVLAENGKDTDGKDNNKACGPTVPHDFVIVKAGTQNTGKTFADASNQYTGPNGVTLYPLSGAEFAIYKSNPNTDANAQIVKTLTQATATDGYYWSVSDLNIDTAYWLVETKAPAGHSLLPQPLEFKLTSRATGSGTNVELTADANNQAKWATSASRRSRRTAARRAPRASWSAAPARPPWSSRTPRSASCPRQAAPESTPTSASQRRSCPGRW